MAVTFDAVGPSSSGTGSATSPLTWTHVNGGNGILVGATIFNGSTNTVTAVTYGGVSVPFLGFVAGGSGGAGGVALYGLTGPTCPTGSNTVSVSFSDGASHNAGSISVAGAGSLGTPATGTGTNTASGTASVSGTTTGGLIVAVASYGGSGLTSFSGTNGVTVQWQHPGTGNSGSDNGVGGTVASTGGGASQTVGFSDGGTDFWGVVAVEVLPPVTTATASLPARPYNAGGATRLRRQYQPARRSLISVPQPASLAAGSATLGGAGSLSTAAAVAPAATLGGAGSLAGVTGRYITGISGSGTGQYFTDNTGAPRMVLGDAAWALCGNAGRWNSGNWQADYDTYLANRSSQGFTVIYTKPMGTTQSGNLDNFGKTFDSLYPFQGGTPSTGVSGANPSSGLTSSFWARIDYFLNSALAKGITVFLNAIGYDSDFSAGPGPLAGKSTTEFQSYGAALGARYAAQPNLVWHLADDYFGENDALISAFLTGLRGAGDTHLVSIENIPESTSRKDLSSGASLAWGASNAQYNFVYTYNVTYFGVEQAYLEASPICVIWGDGYFYQGSSTYFDTFDRAARQDAWWAVSSGARGWINGSESIWQWPSTALASSGTDWWYAHNAGVIRSVMENLNGWHQLVPDTSSLLVTGGRGTRATSFTSGGGGGQYEPAFTDSYVTASRTPDGGSGSSLAVIYLSHATTITIDQTKMGSGYTATWVDPVSGAKSSATTGSTYNSGSKGSNSAGDPDWVLVLQAPVQISGTATLAGAGSLATSATQGTTGTVLGAAGSLTTSATQGTTGTVLGGAASLAAAAVQDAGTALAGTGSLAALVTQGTTGTVLGGTASLAASSGGVAPGAATLGAAGSLGTPAAIQGTAGTVLGGAASLGSLDVTGSSVTLAAAGSLDTAAVLRAGATLGAAGSLTGTQGSGTTKSGPFNIILPGPWARRTSGPLAITLPPPATSLAAFPGTHAPFSPVLPVPVLALTGKASHNPFRIVLPAPRMVLAGTVVHNPFRIVLPAPRAGWTGSRAHAGAFAIVLGRTRGPSEHATRPDTGPQSQAAPVPVPAPEPVLVPGRAGIAVVGKSRAAATEIGKAAGGHAG